MKQAPEDFEEDVLSRFDGKRLIKDFPEVFNNPYYQQFMPEMENLIKGTKNPTNYKDPRRHLNMQLGIFEAIQVAERVSSEGKKSAKAQNDQDLADQSRRNKYLSKAFKEIADGVAWRTLNYDRFIMKVMSHGRSPGHSWGKEGQPAEIQRAMNVVDNGAFALINDVTNILRVGDIMCIPRDKSMISVAEIKKKELITARSISEKIGKKRPLDKQEYRLIQAQISIDTRKFSLQEDKVDLVRVKPARVDFLPGVSAVLKKAMEGGVASKVLAPYLTVEAIDLNVAYNQLGADDLKTRLDAIKRPQGTPLFDHSSYDRIATVMSGEVMRASLTYTVYPFPAKAITKLITGEMYMVGTIYLEPMTAEFAKYGWELYVNERTVEKWEPRSDEDYVNDFSGKVLFPDVDNQADRPAMVMLRNPKTGFNLPVGDLLVQMVCEFTSVKYIVSIAVEMEKHAMANRVGGQLKKAVFADFNDEWRWQ